MVKILHTSCGKAITVSDVDFELANQYRWHITKGYAATTIGHRSTGRATLYLHRLIMGEPDGMEIDHINRVRSDNRRDNLQVCTHAENMKNKGTYEQYKTNKSGVAGVSFLSKLNKWRVSFQKNGVRQYRNFSCKDDAVMMAIKMRAEV